MNGSRNGKKMNMGWHGRMSFHLMKKRAASICREPSVNQVNNEHPRSNSVGVTRVIDSDHNIEEDHTTVVEKIGHIDEELAQGREVLNTQDSKRGMENEDTMVDRNPIAEVHGSQDSDSHESIKVRTLGNKLGFNWVGDTDCGIIDGVNREGNGGVNVVGNCYNK